MNESTTLEAKTQSPEVLKAELTLTLSKEGLVYQKILQDGENISFTRDNWEEEKKKLDELEKVKKSLEGMDNPWTAKWKAWNESKKSLFDPVATTVAKKKADLTKIANEIAADQKKADEDAARIKGIKDSIDNFFIDQSNAIAAATTPEELTRIEKLIGSHKANSSKYAEFLPDLVIKASNLTPLIKLQKDALKTLSGLQEAENAAELTGDDQAILDSREAQEQIGAKIEEAKNTVLEKSLSMATNSTTVIAQPVFNTVAPKRRTWDWEVKDAAALYKKAPHLVELVPDKEKIKAILKEKIENGETKKVTEISYLNNLIRFYAKTTY